MRMTFVDAEEEVIQFAKRAATAFSGVAELTSYTEGNIEKGCLFALRYGLFDDCIIVFRLDANFEPVNFQKIIKKKQTEDEPA